MHVKYQFIPIYIDIIVDLNSMPSPKCQVPLLEVLLRGWIHRASTESCISVFNVFHMFLTKACAILDPIMVITRLILNQQP
jgi:hypothetical protein